MSWELALRILIISQYWAPENGVPQRRWSWLSKVLNEAGHEVFVVAPKPHYERNVSLRDWYKKRAFRSAMETTDGGSGEKVIRSGFIPSSSSVTGKIFNQAVVAVGALWVIMKRPSSLKEYSPDLIVGTVPAIPTALVTYVASRRFKAPYIIDLRDAWPDLLAERSRWNHSVGDRSVKESLLSLGPIQILSALTRSMLNRVLKNANVITVTSQMLGEDLEQRKELRSKGCQNPKTITVRNVFPPEAVYASGHCASSNKRSLNVLYAGTVGRAQDLENTIVAAALCEASGYRVRLRFVGSGVGKPKLLKLARDYGVNAEFFGRLPVDKLQEHYDWADTGLVHLADWPSLQMVVPSKTYELMGIKLHISAVARGESAKLIQEHGAGDVVPPGDPFALSELWTKLIEEPDRLCIGDRAAAWVTAQRQIAAPKAILEAIMLAAQDKN
ncbi:glycosyltransferase family 4 protein [Corynebacterium lipophilum]|uniref:glycosyltransferase family 4 protein n=1 Tax=Corynebacterium lipophilum TaxID=2804918 RepID=UPI002E7B1F46|nr:glycosyltransferase family 4 protein [Corynebacterium lipophilum]